ncbi:hypothetical protein Dimus_011137 [Dionaea muscipula]
MRGRRMPGGRIPGRRMPDRRIPGNDQGWPGRPRVFEALNVPLDDKEGVDPVKTDFFKETFLNMCQLKRENGICWLGTGENRRRDDVEEAEHEEMNEGENIENEEADFVWEQVEEIVLEGEQAQEAQLQGVPKDKEGEVGDSGSEEKFYDNVDEERSVDEGVPVLEVPTAPVNSRRGRPKPHESTPRDIC